MSRWKIYNTLFAVSDEAVLDANAELEAEWDRLRAEATSDHEREEIDAIFARHAA
jgi:hypothetical protein